MKKLLSNIHCLSRLRATPAIIVRTWYKPIAHDWLKYQARSLQQIRLKIYGTKVGFAYQLLIVSLTYRKRAVPITWTWIMYIKGDNTPKA